MLPTYPYPQLSRIEHRHGVLPNVCALVPHRSCRSCGKAVEDDDQLCECVYGKEKQLP